MPADHRIDGVASAGAPQDVLAGLLRAAPGARCESLLARLALAPLTADPGDAALPAAHVEDDLTIIERELARLFAVRELFLGWVQDLRAAPGSGSGLPAQFLRAWGDSTGRVIQLLRARRDLTGSRQDALLDAVYDELEQYLAGDLPAEGPVSEVASQTGSVGHPPHAAEPTLEEMR